MGSKFIEKTYGAPGKQILSIPDHYVALGFRHAQASAVAPGVAVLENGRYVVKAGTIYPANDETAIGVVLNDYDVTDGDQMMAVVVHGFIKKAALPVLPASAAVAAMKMISFNPLANMGVVLTATKATIAAGEAEGKTHTIVVSITGATFRPEAATLTNWTIAGESANKVAVESIVVSDDKTFVIVTTKNSAAAVAGSTTIVPLAAATSTGQVPASAITIATVA
jgi:hypothetical protein